MYRIDSGTKQIHLTRGDAATIGISAKKGDTNYTFQVGDVVRLNVFKAKDCNCIELTKDVIVEEETELVNISLTDDDTKIGEVINKPTKYWYEVILNPNTNEQTIIGYDEDGAKEFILYPEAKENE